MDVAEQIEIDRDRARARLAKARASSNSTGLLSPSQREALEIDPQAWLKHFFPDQFDRPFANSQKEFLASILEIEPDEYFEPICLCDPRGLGKSTVTEGAGVFLFATGRRNYWLITSATDGQAMKHQASVKKMMEAPLLLANYPHLKAKVQSVRAALEGWSAERLICESGQQIEFSSLLGKMRGFKSAVGKRPDLWTPDDIDDPSESSDVTTKKREIMRLDFLPALSKNKEGELLGSVIWPQNLIHRNSIMRQVLDFSADMLNDRKFIGPNPLMAWYDAERVTLESGKPHWRIIDGQPFDPATSLKYCEQLLNQLGKIGFDRECQQLVDIVNEENDFREWNEIYHIATVSEVIAGFKRNGATLTRDAYGQLRIPDRWECGDGHDWGTTPGHPAVYTLFTRPDARFPFPDVHLGLIERCLPKYPRDRSVESELVSPGRFAATMTLARRSFGLQDAQIKLSLMSHEASAALASYLIDCPADTKVFFAKWKASKGSGVPQMQNLMEVDKKRPHPFRVYPRGHAQAGQPVMGYTRFILVVPDGQGELYADQAGILRVTAGTNEQGFARARFEIPLYCHRNQGTKKTDDDWVDAARGILAQFAIRSGQKTIHEQVEEEIPAQWRTAAIATMPPQQRDSYYAARAEEYEEARERIQNKRRPSTDWSGAFDEGGAGDID